MKTLLSVLLAFVLLGSTLPLRVSWHSCGGRVVDWSLRGEAEACDHADLFAAAGCPLHADMPDVRKKKCCADHMVILEGESPVFSKDRQIPVPLVATPLPVFLIAPAVAPASDHGWSSIAHWHPPPLSGREIVVRSGVFLI